MRKKELLKLIDLIFDFKIKYIKRWLELGINGLYFLDDWGNHERSYHKSEALARDI